MLNRPFDGDVVGVDVSVNGKARADLTVWRIATEERLAVDTLNVVSARERASLVERLPEDVRADALAVLEDVAQAVVEYRGGAGVGSADGAPSTDKPGAGRGIDFPVVEPWPEPVDGAALLAEIVRVLCRFLALPDGAATAIALWIVHTYALAAARVSPILGITSPEKRCGKTTLLTVLAALVPRALPTSNVTPAALFRTIECFAPTMLVDEADTFLPDKDELRGIVNSGHCRDTAFVVRTVGDDFEPRRFSTWCAKAIAAIGRLPETIADRAIMLRLQRRTPDQAVERLRIDRLHSELAPLCRRIARFAQDNVAALREADPPMPGALNDRASDNWRPLLAIADRAGGDWAAEARRAAVLLSGADAGEDAESNGTRLLADLCELFGETGRTELRSEDIAHRLNQREDRPWPGWNRSRGLDAAAIAKLLKPYGVKPKLARHHEGAKPFRAYRAADFADVFRRYLPGEPVTPVTARRDNDLSAPAPVTAPGGCNTSAEAVSACEGSPVTGVTGAARGAEPPRTEDEEL